MVMTTAVLCAVGSAVAPVGDVSVGVAAPAPAPAPAPLPPAPALVFIDAGAALQLCDLLLSVAVDAPDG